MKYNKTLKALLLSLYEIYSSWWESRNKYSTRFACAIFIAWLSPQAVYFIQTGGSALSNTYGSLGANNELYPVNTLIVLNKLL